MNLRLICLLGSVLLARQATAAQQIELRVDRRIPGAPVTSGIPFPKGALSSPDEVRLVNERGIEVPSQVTEVNTWAPASPSVQWIWLDFITDGSARYRLEYGPGVRRQAEVKGSLRIVNSQRPAGGVDVDTGVMRFHITRGAGGFIDRAELARGGNAIPVLGAPGDRGSFLDLLDDQGKDASKAVVNFTTLEKGSGPLHAIIRIEGEYRYARSDNRPAPFVTRLHVWAGEPWIRVLHTIVYTGVPDKRRPQTGQHAHVATKGSPLIQEDPSDKGITEPNDRIRAAGLTFNLAEPAAQVETATYEGTWWQPGAEIATGMRAGSGRLALFQTGPDPTRMPPLPESSDRARLSGFSATASAGTGSVRSGDSAPGWFTVEGARAGITLMFKDMLREFPKAFALESDSRTLTAGFWPEEAGAMSFARYSTKPENEEGIQTLQNDPTGLAKTTELSIVLHTTGRGAASRPSARALAEPVMAIAPPRWYAASGAFGRLAPRTAAHPELERALDTKFDWWIHNQNFVPWYGMWDYGDGKLNFDPETGEWDIWGDNEPAEDLQLWMQFVRTGDPRYARAAQALSRHSMDVDNIHWPAPRPYRGDTNTSSDFWKSLQEPQGTPYLGLGRRHGAQHWLKTLSAHVWVAGWLADYYLTGDHRGLDAAIQTGEMHLRTIFGDHDLTGRRLYLSIWNLAEVWNATKDRRFRAELDARLERLLALQKEQGDSLVVERYGYSHNYVIRGVERVLDVSDSTAQRQTLQTALVTHARRVRDVPPLNHQMESYLSSLGALVSGYNLTHDPGMLAEMRKRLDLMRLDPVGTPFSPAVPPGTLGAAIEKASHLPDDSARPGGRGLWASTNGLRVFGWTHAFTLPFALRSLEDAELPTRPPVRKPVASR